MSEPRKTVILLILLAIGIATIFWGRWRLKSQLEHELSSPANAITIHIPAPVHLL